MATRLKDVRISFAQGLFDPQALEAGATPKFNCHFIFLPDHPALAALKEAVVTAAKAKWPNNWQAVLQQLQAADRVCVRDGASKADKAYGEAYKGAFFVTASNEIRPTVVDCVAGPDGKARPLTKADGKPYSGCYVNAEVDVWAMDNKWGKRVNATLMGVQFLRDGPRLSGAGVSAPSAFEAIPDSAAPFGSGEPESKGVASIFG
jgi:hypothetical protein